VPPGTWRISSATGRLTGQVLSAEGALGWGPVSSLHEREELPAVLAIADRIAATDTW
jgi:enoyl-CoA hydratase/carnithine racemase